MSNLSSSTNEANDEPFSNRFAFLTPDNVRAAAALVTVVASHTPSLLQHQRKFIEVVDAKTSSSPSSPSSSSSSSPASSKSLEEKKKTLDSGHQQDSVTTSPYRFVLDLDQLPSGPNLSWQIGKGHAKKEHHGVDLMLCHPNDLLNSRLVSQVVALISIHPASGAFMLQAISSRCPITYLSGDGNRDIVLKAGAKTVLHMTENRLRIGPTTLEALDYVLRIDVADEARFRAVRDEVLQYHVAPDSMHYPRLDPHWHLDALPKQAHHRVRDVVIHRTISSGAFGIVRSGVHTLTGAAVAIKTIHCKSRDVRSIKNELQIATLLARNYEGIVPALDTWCEHGDSPPCFDQPLEDIHISMPLARHNFQQTDWAQIDMGLRLALFRQTLHGLQHLHSLGIMHRDISPKNLLVFSATADAPRAGICDFGKAIKSTHAHDTNIGPIHTVAPEVWAADLSMDRPYTTAVDVWSLAYAWLFTFQRPPDLKLNPRTDAHRCRALIDAVSQLGAADRIPSSLSGLMSSMLNLSPEARPTASQALEHPVWILIQRDQELRNWDQEKHSMDGGDSPDLGIRTPSPAPQPVKKKPRVASPSDRLDPSVRDGDPSCGNAAIDLKCGSNSLPDTEPFS